jgi:hypothetical protein
VQGRPLLREESKYMRAGNFGIEILSHRSSVRVDECN